MENKTEGTPTLTYYESFSCIFLSQHVNIYYPHQVMLLLFVLLTQIRDLVPALREALNVFVWALRQLDGQVHSFEGANVLGVLPGSHTLEKSKIKQIQKQLVRGLSLLEGALPISHLNPGMHHFAHYALYSSTHGLLRTLWMFFFER